MIPFDPAQSIGQQSRWRQVRYLLAIRSWREAFGVVIGRRYTWQF